MRIIRPSAKRRSTKDIANDKSSDSEVELGDCTFCDAAASSKVAIFANKVARPEREGSSERKISSSQTGVLTMTAKELPAGKRRRRSEIDPDSLKGLGADSGLGSSSHDMGELFEPMDESKKERVRLFASGVRLLSMREHSIRELRDKLLAKTELTDIAYAVVDELIEKKYVSDERFAESYVRYRTNKGFGPVKIRTELKTKGISAQLIEDNIDMNAAAWYDNAAELHQRKYRGAPVSDYKAWTKRARFLQSRGFTMEHIHAAIRRPEFD